MAAIVLVLLACAIVFFFVYDQASKTLAGPTTTRTASGFHYYTPLHGGVSFDYPSNYINFLDRLGNNQAFSLLTNNPTSTGVFLLDPQKGNDSLVSVTIKAATSNSTAWSEETCSSQLAKDMLYLNSTGLDATRAKLLALKAAAPDAYEKELRPLADASYEWTMAGGKGVCVVGMPLTTRNGTYYVITTHCAGNGIGIGGPDKGVVLGIFAALRCGQEAG